MSLLANDEGHFVGKVLEILTQLAHSLFPAPANDECKDRQATIAFCNSFQQEAVGH